MGGLHVVHFWGHLCSFLVCFTDERSFPRPSVVVRHADAVFRLRVRVLYNSADRRQQHSWAAEGDAGVSRPSLVSVCSPLPSLQPSTTMPAFCLCYVVSLSVSVYFPAGLCFHMHSFSKEETVDFSHIQQRFRFEERSFCPLPAIYLSG